MAQENKPTCRHERVSWLQANLGIQGLEYATDRKVKILFERYFNQLQKMPANDADKGKLNLCIICGEEVKVQLVCGCGVNEAIS
ncbi:hypothetical protein L1N85_19660 [Paenibacillus alkaliterrae]|uniref:hypothetical protein n=1 Tax=Paenibacillus alkaliterrae TaxID=320909 RepID=UPI001F2F7A1A|nr:hypothetical protein [Paenibacillus alkaliterrae]MCF2940614.1 hypothetical protein [Paenibacillus alkaliterrae]